MKFGKSYLASSAQYPPEWQQAAIEYRKLKKVINRVAEELTSLGLTSEVLKDLLEQHSHHSSKENNNNNNNQNQNNKLSELSLGDEEVGEGESATKGKVVENAKSRGSSSSKKGKEREQESSADDDELDSKAREKSAARMRRRPRASYELAGTSALPEPRIRLIFSSASSGSQTDSSGSEDHPLLRRQSSDTEDISNQNGNSNAQDDVSSSLGKNRFSELLSSEEDSEKKSEEVEVIEGGLNNEDSSGFQSLDGTLSDEPEFLNAGFKENHLLKKMYGVGIHSSDDDFEPEPESNSAWLARMNSIKTGHSPSHSRTHSRSNSYGTFRNEPTTPRTSDGRRGSFETIRENAASLEKEEERRKSGGIIRVEEGNDTGVEADDEGLKNRQSLTRGKRRHHHRQHHKEVFIPLNSDTEFLTLLAQALASIAALQVAQKQQFAQAVEILAREVSNVSSPSRPKTDLYVWREIFSLWVETQIFESSREKDRGERTAEEAEEKLDWFVDQVAKRKLAKKMRHKESRTALEKFIKLNVELLDMKRFQMANEEAARKILKKHDKRTALTASSGFPQFIAAASNLSAISDGSDTRKRGTLVLFGLTSLPHILLTTFTSTLLPIIPQLDDYECAICGEVAFKPIRLDCTHKFCVRCLVKMQKRGQNACPQCRAPVVLQANAANLDDGLQEFLKMWFPREVKLKKHQNAIEAGKEEALEMGMEDRCTIT